MLVFPLHFHFIFSSLWIVGGEDGRAWFRRDLGSQVLCTRVERLTFVFTLPIRHGVGFSSVGYRNRGEMGVQWLSFSFELILVVFWC